MKQTGYIIGTYPPKRNTKSITLKFDTYQYHKLIMNVSITDWDFLYKHMRDAYINGEKYVCSFLVCDIKVPIEPFYDTDEASLFNDNSVITELPTTPMYPFALPKAVCEITFNEVPCNAGFINTRRDMSILIRNLHDRYSKLEAYYTVCSDVFHDAMSNFFNLSEIEKNMMAEYESIPAAPNNKYSKWL